MTIIQLKLEGILRGQEDNPGTRKLARMYIKQERAKRPSHFHVLWVRPTGAVRSGRRTYREAKIELREIERIQKRLGATCRRVVYAGASVLRYRWPNGIGGSFAVEPCGCKPSDPADPYVSDLIEFVNVNVNPEGLEQVPLC